MVVPKQDTSVFSRKGSAGNMDRKIISSLAKGTKEIKMSLVGSRHNRKEEHNLSQYDWGSGGVGLQSLTVTLHLTFRGTARVVPKGAFPFYVSTGNVRALISPDFYQYFFDSSFPCGCEVLFHCGWVLISFMATDVEHLFMLLLAICMLLKKCLFWFFNHF